MGEGPIIKDVIKSLATRITLDGTTLSVAEDVDTGCKATSPSEASSRYTKCETRCFNAPTAGLWVNQVILQPLLGGKELWLRRATEDPRPGEDDIWKHAQGRIKWALGMSQWTLDYLNKARQLNLLSLRKVGAGNGEGKVIPRCAERTLLSVAVFFSKDNIRIEYSASSDIAPFASQLCVPQTLWAKNQ